MESHFEGKDPEELFSEIYKKYRKLRITSDDFLKLSAIKKLREKKYFKREKVLYFVLAAFVIICALFISIGRDSLIIYFAKIWFYFSDYDIKDEKCVFDMPPELQNMFLPPFDCSVCRNLSTVQRVINISPQDFEKRFAYTAVPVIISDGTANWTAMDTFSFEFFKQLYLERDKTEQGGWECQFFPYKTEFYDLFDALSMSTERSKQPWYFGWSNCDIHIGKILRKHYHRPYFLPSLSESSNIDWIFTGTPGYGAYLHIDHVGNPSWQAQLKGRKLWTLEPVPECYNECPRSIEAIVNPGEVIVLDTNRWYHKTEIIGDDVSITIGSEYD